MHMRITYESNHINDWRCKRHADRNAVGQTQVSTRLVYVFRRNSQSSTFPRAVREAVADNQLQKQYRGTCSHPRSLHMSR